MSELSDRLRDYSHKSAVMAHYHTRNGLRDDADYWSAHAADMLAAAELLESRAPVQASEARGDWVLVPRHPTVEMMIEGQNADDMQHTTQTIAEIYKAMISAHTQAGPVG